MSFFEFASTLVLSVVSLVVAIWAVKLALKGNHLLITLTESLQAIEKSNRRRKVPKNVILETTKQKELNLKEQKESREALELELRKQQQEWKRKKDVAKLIGWFLDRLESDDE